MAKRANDPQDASGSGDGANVAEGRGLEFDLLAGERAEVKPGFGIGMLEAQYAARALDTDAKGVSQQGQPHCSTAYLLTAYLNFPSKTQVARISR